MRASRTRPAVGKTSRLLLLTSTVRRNVTTVSTPPYGLLVRLLLTVAGASILLPYRVRPQERHVCFHLPIRHLLKAQCNVERILLILKTTAASQPFSVRAAATSIEREMSTERQAEVKSVSLAPAHRHGKAGRHNCFHAAIRPSPDKAYTQSTI